ncbi:MAG: hypothetical protein K6A65_02710, partial [Succinivibrionaceae bacterium]|nr:hypothetical protein [Succinivibrionaceae bacterium]
MTEQIHSFSNNASYYLSSSGEVKQAGFWQKFKCLLNIGDGRDKVRNLIAEIKTNLREAAAGASTRQVFRDLEGLDTTSNISGARLNEIIGRFKAQEAGKINTITARNEVSKMIGAAVDQLSSQGKVEDNAKPAMGELLRFILKPTVRQLLNGIAQDAGQPDPAAIREKVEKPLAEAVEMLSTISDSKLQGRGHSTLYLDYVKASLYDPKGNRNQVGLESLKEPDEAGRELLEATIGKIQSGYQDEKARASEAEVRQLIDTTVDKISDNEELASIALSYPEFALKSSDGRLRSAESFAKRLDAVSDNLKEINDLGSQLEGFRTLGLECMNSLKTASFPQGYISGLFGQAQQFDLGALSALGPKSTPTEIHRAMLALQAATAAALGAAGSAGEVAGITGDPERLRG